jgi:hypothetical protein
MTAGGIHVQDEGCKLAIFINTKHGWRKADHFLYGIQ